MEKNLVFFVEGRGVIVLVFILCTGFKFSKNVILSFHSLNFVIYFKRFWNIDLSCMHSTIHTCVGQATEFYDGYSLIVAYINDNVDFVVWIFKRFIYK